ncbi:MAG: folylpolyglutamate synthase/dihydrofolate synthase family protein [Polaromonas sp.]|uniref:bifunctional folylpolyglutamate synthase/dihydrofolate synthase n=1 Tax=Polaromonas sp. TaxID=1869339 RepID=UPI002734FE08|nr:folylpolyglutamate synthase/dihydrofolate synthase family protein [Polaromonas sp.]MDP3799762.1 folylpolyglutamate synthase/dihydrofolate synthase family protein [Polaromonas sp.]
MEQLNTLQDWLAHCERLHPKSIDMGLERVQAVARRMGLAFACPVITVAGTNGKGSTCAMLEAILLEAGYRTGVYTSPHLVHFEERCRVRGDIVNAADLVANFARVEAARVRNGDEISLTYFEFTTLAILQLLADAKLDVVILEVGLGGRLDAVNILDTDCAVITSIDLDHMEFLGNDRETIGREKAGIMRAGKPVVVSDPVPPQSILDHAAALGADLWRFGQDFNFSGDKQQWSWVGRADAGPPQGSTAPLGGSAVHEVTSVGAKTYRRYAGLAYPALRGANQLVNASGVLAALTALRNRLPVTAQAVRNGLSVVELPGRFQIVPGQPTLVLDVAHNPHSVAALAENLDAMGFYPCTHAVFGAMADKDLAPMLARVGPLIDKWYFTDLPTARAASGEELAAKWRAVESRPDVTATTHKDPELALQAAVRAADPADRIVVFGSFYTVGGVLKGGVPRLMAPHLVQQPGSSGTK